jgi:hypothetical protein
VSRHLDGDFLVLQALRRVRRGGLALRGEQFCDRGQPMPSGLLVDTLGLLIELGHLQVADPAPQTGLASLRLTDTGAGCYAKLAAQQRAALLVPPPEHATTETPAERRPGTAPLGPGGRPHTTA